jgi:transforming growth factor-beta-induced protein
VAPFEVSSSVTLCIASVAIALRNAMFLLHATLAAAALLLAAPRATYAADDLSTVLSKTANLTTFTSLLSTYGKDLPQSGVTILAPSDAAFRKDSSWNSKNATRAAELLQYSVLRTSLSMSSIVKGQSVFAQTYLNQSAETNVTGGQNIIFTKQPNGDVVLTSGLASRSTVLSSDISFDGGLIQVIDSLTVVPVSLEDTARNAYTDLEAFVGAAYASGLQPTIANTPNITLFVPRNAAFQAVAGALGGLSNDSLQHVLEYHMVQGAVLPSYSLTGNLTLQTAGNGSLSITRVNNDIFVNSARIIQTDVLIANGVVQMLDAVLNPDNAARPNTEGGGASQSPVWTATGGAATATATGSAAVTPFVTDLPCRTDCSTSGASLYTGATGTHTSSTDAAPIVRCTGLPAIGIGVGLVAGLGMGVVGLA